MHLPLLLHLHHNRVEYVIINNNISCSREVNQIPCTSFCALEIALLLLMAIITEPTVEEIQPRLICIPLV